MSPKILQVNFNFSVSKDDLGKAFADLADQFAAVPGCRWKIWMINDEKKEAGGVYLFDDQESIDKMMNTPLIASVVSHPALTNFTVKTFEVSESVTRITRGPIDQARAAAD